MDILSIRGMQQVVYFFVFDHNVPVQAAGSLNPVFHDSLDPIFRPGDLSAVPSYSVCLQPGQLLFVPAGSPHQVRLWPDAIVTELNCLYSVFRWKTPRIAWLCPETL